MNAPRILATAFAAALVIFALAPAFALADPVDHVVTGTEIQGQMDQKVQSQDADRQVIRDLLDRPDVRRVAGKAGFDLTHADDAVNTLSGPELSRLAAQARDVNSQLAGGATLTMTWTMLILIVVAIVVLIAIL